MDLEFGEPLFKYDVYINSSLFSFSTIKAPTPYEIYTFFTGNLISGFSLRFWPKIKQFLSNELPSLSWFFSFTTGYFHENVSKSTIKLSNFKATLMLFPKFC